MATPVAIGVDNGGTWIRLKGINAQGQCVWSLKKPSPTVEKLPAFLHHHLNRFQGKLTHLAVGSRGVWKLAKRKTLQRGLRGLAKNIVVMSDVEAAWLAAFGPHPAYGHLLPKGRRPTAHGGVGPLPLGEGARRAGEGILVIAGTGSIAYGRTSGGKSARAGGWGPDKGDEGSGYWIGREWLKRKRRTVSRPPVRKIAALTPSIIRKARSGDSMCEEILRKAQHHLADMVSELIRKLSWIGTVPLSVSGSVLENKEFRSGFFKSLRESRIRFQFIQKHTDPAMAIISHAFR